MKKDSQNNKTDVSDRGKTVEKLEKAYKGEYGKYMFYGGQVFVFLDGNIVNKTLLIQSKEPKTHFDRPYLKFNAKPVYENDSEQDLEETISGFKEEYEWFVQTFKDVPGISIPEERYSICNDPMGSENKTVLISTEYIPNIKGDIFRIKPKILHKFIMEDEEFKQSLISLVRIFLSLSKQDIYPDYIGADNIAIYLIDKKPRIALIDPHIVWVGKECNELVSGRLKRATDRFKRFIENPEDYESIVYLTSEGLM